MKAQFLVSACAIVAMTIVAVTPTPSHAQSAGAMLGGLAGGVIGGVIAGSMAAHAARQRPVVVYGGSRRHVREVRRAPRHAVARADRRPMQPAAGPSGPQVVNASADPFASPRGNATATVNQSR